MQPAESRVPGRAIALCAVLLATLSVVAEPAHTVLLRGGDLYTVSHGVLPSTDLLIVDGRIAGIERSIDPPSGTEIVDVRGQRVYPGLIALQSTLGLSEIGAVRASDDRREVGDVTPEVAAHVAYTPDSEIIPTVRSHGITTAQIVPGGALIRGRSFVTHLDGWTKEDAQVRLVDALQVSWPALSVRYGWWIEGGPEEQQERIEERRRTLLQAFENAAAYGRARAHDPTLPVDLRWEAMLPTVRGERPVYIVANDYRQILEAVAFARERELKLVLVGGKESHRVTDLLREQRVPVVLGSTTSLPQRSDDDYDQAFKLPRQLHEAGVTFCLSHVTWGSWAVRNLPFQAGQAVAFGLPPEVALRSITLSAAEILGIDRTEGSLEVGKDATLFVSDGDVMNMLGQKVTRMYIRGRPVDLDDRHKRLFRKYLEKGAR